MNTGIVDLYQYSGIQPTSGAAAKLTYWLPSAGTGRRRPAVLILPGGGYEHVSRREAEPVALRFAAAGYGAFVLEYSVAPHTFPTALREAAMAMACIRGNADLWQLDPGMVAAVGFSAGAHLCGCLGTLFDGEAVADIASGAVIRPDALGLCYPVAVAWGRTHEGSFRNLSGGVEALRQRLSLDALVRPDMPPSFLWHTRTDESVPCRNSLILATAMEEMGVPFALHIYRSGPHGLSTADAMAYPADAVPDMSSDVPGWIHSLLGFLQELGFQITDREVLL